MKPKLSINQYGKWWTLPNGELHREDGPAIETSDYKAFYINGERHREDGPALEYASGTKLWWINGMYYTEQEYKHKIRSIKLTRLLNH
jgi:hypothetical protein